VFNLFRSSGWGRLPPKLLVCIKDALGSDFELLDDLARRHGLFHQHFFRQRDYSDLDTQILSLAFLIGSLGNQLGQRELFEDAELAYLLSLTLKPDKNPAVSGLAHLYALNGDVTRAVGYVKQALDLLWDSADMRKSESGMQTHVLLAKILVEDIMLARVGEQELEHARELVTGHEMTNSQRDRLVYASLEVGGPQHEQAIAELLHVTADSWFDFADMLAHDLSKHAGALTSEQTIQRKAHLLRLKLATDLAIVCTKIDPNHVDSWVLAANLGGASIALGAGDKGQAFVLALEALERIERYLSGNKSLFTKDPALIQRSEESSSVTALLKKTIQATRDHAAPELLQRAEAFFSQND
jgi:hypothetical protein